MIPGLILLIITGIVGLIVFWKLYRSILVEIVYAIYGALIIAAFVLFVSWYLSGAAACVIF